MTQLRAHRLLAGCTRRQLEQIDGLGTRLDVRPGRTLIREGAPGRECFLIIGGTAMAHRGDTRLDIVPTGSLAGELALLDGTARSATVVATTPMRLVVLTPTEFTDLLAVAPCVEDRICELAAQRRSALERPSLAQRLQHSSAGHRD